MKTYLWVDTETTGLRPYKGDRLFSLIIANQHGALYFNFQAYPGLGEEYVLTRDHLKALSVLFDDVGKLWFLQNAQYDMAKVTRLPVKKQRPRGHGAGAKAVFAVLQETPIARKEDFIEAVRAANLAVTSISGILNDLEKYGLLVRQAHGAYRLPTEDEKLRRGGE